MKRIIEFCFAQQRIVLSVFLVGIMLSGFQLMQLKLDVFPDVTDIQVSVNTEAPGMAAKEVEQLVTYPVESLMYSIPSVKAVRSISKTGLSIVTIVFEESTDPYFAREQVFQRLRQAEGLLPESIDAPAMGPNSSGLGQVFQYLLVADPESAYHDPVKLRSLNDYLVKLILMPVDGVTDILSFGGEVKQYQVNLDPQKLFQLGLSIEDVQQALLNSNQNAGGWYLNRGDEQFVIRGVGRFSSNRIGLRQIEDVPLLQHEGRLISVRDIASVSIGGEIRQGAVTMTERQANGQLLARGEVISGIVLKRFGANTKQTIDDVKALLPKIQTALPDGVSIQPYYDNSDLVEKAVSTLTISLVQAAVLVLVVLFLFLFNLRATLLVLVTVPLSLLMALAMLAYFDISANLMSLGGMVIAIGMLVDSAVVMVEGIMQRAEKETVEAQATRLAKPMVFSFAIIMMVLAPLTLLTGVEGKLFIPMIISIMLALCFALLIALFLLPLLAKHLLSNSEETSSSQFSNISARYRQLLVKLSQHPKKLGLCMLIMIGLSSWFATQIGTEFVPELEEGTINLRVTLAPTANLNVALALAPKLEDELMQFPEVTYALSRIGRAEIGGDPEPISNIEIYIGLKPVSEWKSAKDRYALQSKMATRLKKFPGLLLTFSQPIATRVDELLSGVKSQLAIKIFGPDLNQLGQLAAEATQKVQQVNGAIDVAMEQFQGEAQLEINVKRDVAAQYGLTVADVMQVVNAGIGGTAAGQVFEGNARYDIYVRYQNEDRNNLHQIRQIPIQGAEGTWLQLSDVAEVGYQKGVSQVRRENVQRRVVIQANVANRDMGSVVNDIQTQLNQIKWPAGYYFQIGGQYENQQRAQKTLSWLLPVILAGIAILLYFAFGNLRQVAILLICIPFALMGGIWSLYLSGAYLSVPSSIGFIALIGLAVLNGVVLTDSLNYEFAQRALSFRDAVIRGCEHRLRPVLMTAMTTALGLLPLLYSQGVGSEIQKPMAIVLIGGLISSTILTLFVLPLATLVWMKPNSVEHSSELESGQLQQA
ncbi:efflux RND transporter permease subunit [Algicola sagamiensis]|uniref:efflux RND transporter permease subunit n=1 Tax=Algicola sagamiensis TaxID=163869 RepID=UPI00036A6DA4|nr:CusA/CzcA family heavy metal efflux RND transporter [Algicola sagamiensis]